MPSQQKAEVFPKTTQALTAFIERVVNERLEETTTKLSEADTVSESLKKQLEEANLRVAELSAKLESLTGKVTVHDQASERREADQREKNVIIRGVPEDPNETIESTVTSILKHGECSFGWTEVVKAHRMGRRRRPATEERGGEAGQPARPRNIRLELHSRAQRTEIFRAKRKITEDGRFKAVQLSTDCNSKEMLQEKTVQQLHALAKKDPGVTSSYMRGKSIQINGILYKPHQFAEIKPDTISPEKAATREYSWGTAFQGHNAPMSNFYPSKIKNVDGTKTYCSAEQYYTAVMAKHHGLKDVADQVEKTENPYHVKAIARSIVRSGEWNAKCDSVLADIVKRKFDQNPELKLKLMSYPGASLIECTKCPKWGSGYYLEESHKGETALPGHKNRMGAILVKLRAEYRK